MTVIRSLLLGMLIFISIASACDPPNFNQNDPQGVRTVFSAEDIPDKSELIFYEIDWSLEDKLTIQGWSIGYDVGLVGDTTSGNMIAFYMNNSVLSGSVPLISKDGRYLSFQSYDPPSLYIVSMDKVASNNYAVTPDSYVDVLVGKDYPCSDRAWSPDSSQLAFVCVDLHDTLTISLYGLAKKNVQDIFEYSEEHLNGVERVSWSPDGTMLALSLRYEYHDGQVSQTDIFVYHLDTGSLDRITRTLREDENNPDWYPGTRIFTYQLRLYGVGEPDSSLVFSTEDGKCMKTLRTLKGFVYPSWSPDGSQLAYIDDWEEIKVMDTARFVPPAYLTPEGLCSPDTN